MSWISKEFNEAKVSRAISNAREEALYAQVALELSQGEIRAGLWAKALSVAEGDEGKAKARYLSLRVEQIQIQLGAANAIEHEFSMHTPAGMQPAEKATRHGDPTASAQALITAGCRVRRISASEWEILHSSGVTEVARSPEALQDIANRSIGSGPGAA